MLKDFSLYQYLKSEHEPSQEIPTCRLIKNASKEFSGPSKFQLYHNKLIRHMALELLKIPLKEDVSLQSTIRLLWLSNLMLIPGERRKAAPWT